ncbi:hypothetical protein FJY90_05795 [Candidatus Gottesmanbacteria bacterium]|nr:hypothetical protein [Candidatus Gottesmanbacteria bacterium]
MRVWLKPGKTRQTLGLYQVRMTKKAARELKLAGQHELLRGCSGQWQKKGSAKRIKNKVEKALGLPRSP